MKKSFSKQIHNPIDLIKTLWPEADISHIEFDPDMKKGEYQIIRQSGGDGTILFTMQMMAEALGPLVNMQSYFKPKKPKSFGEIKAITYKIGPMKHATIFGIIKFRFGKRPGQRERVRIPVVCELVYK